MQNKTALTASASDCDNNAKLTLDCDCEKAALKYENAKRLGSCTLR